MANTAALSKLSESPDCTTQRPLLSPSLPRRASASPVPTYSTAPECDRQTSKHPYGREEKNHYFKSVWLFCESRPGAESWGCLKRRPSSLILQPSNLINWLLIYWDGAQGAPRLWKQTPKPDLPTAPRVARNWGQLTVRWTHAPANPFRQNRRVLIYTRFLGREASG